MLFSILRVIIVNDILTLTMMKKNYFSYHGLSLLKHHRLSRQRILKEKTDSTFIQLFRYLFVGGFAFVVDFSTLYILTDTLHIYYLVSAIPAFIMGTIVNYLLSISWIFGSRRLKNKLNEILIFTAIGGLGLVFNTFLIWFFTEIFHVYYMGSKIIAAPFVFLWNFLARKYILFFKSNS